MAQALIIGFVVLFGVMLVGRLFVTAQPATVLRVLKWGGLTVAVVALVAMFRTGMIGLLLAAVAALVPWLIRAMQAHAAFRYFRNAVGGPAAGWRNAGASAGAGAASQVETRFLRMTLDHDTGAFDGEVLEGASAGRRLAQLSPAELARLWRDCQADPQSAQVLEAWLERMHPDWREHFRDAEASGPSPGGRMTPDEAYAILGVAPGAGPDDIRAAHRRLMMACHPDHGGSDWLAARLNQAKDVLLPD